MSSASIRVLRHSILVSKFALISFCLSRRRSARLSFGSAPELVKGFILTQVSGVGDECVGWGRARASSGEHQNNQF